MYDGECKWFNELPKGNYVEREDSESWSINRLRL